MITTKRNTQKGFTLIEIMLALLLSSFLVGMIAMQLSTMQKVAKHQDTMLIIEENARYIFDKLKDEIEDTNYRSDDPTITSDEFAEVFFTGNCIPFNPCTADGAGQASDRFAIYYRPEPPNLTPPVAAGQIRACNGTDLTQLIGNNQNILTVYYIGADPVTNLNNLYCQTYFETGGVVAPVDAFGPQPVLAGIENMQVLYGIQDVNRGQAVSYVSATTVEATSINGSPDAWGFVVSAKLEVLVGSGLGDDLGHRDQRSFQLADSPTYTPAATPANVDYCYAHLCKTFSSTIAIKNQLQEL